MTQKTTREREERRRAQRYSQVGEHRIVMVRVRPDQRARVIDASVSGALLETQYRLLPGRRVELHMETSGKEQVTVSGQVVRCAVARVHATFVCYRGAIAFERHLPWFVEPPGYAVPRYDYRPGRPYQAPASPVVG
jgi:PilZ domain